MLKDKGGGNGNKPKSVPFVGMMITTKGSSGGVFLKPTEEELKAIKRAELSDSSEESIKGAELLDPNEEFDGTQDDTGFHQNFDENFKTDHGKLSSMH